VQDDRHVRQSEILVSEALRHTVPVFPLPELVLFPGTAVSLHVFELRYRTLVRDALSRDRTIALALLAPGFEIDYHGSPPFHPLGCLARFNEVEWLPDDRYYLKVAGTVRVRFDRVVAEFPYRAMRVELLPQDPYDEDDPLVRMEKRALLELYGRLRALATETSAEAAATLPALESSERFERVVNTLCMTCGQPAAERLALLAENSLVERARIVRECMERVFGATRRRERPSGEAN
jgi:Lon protease-like protein